MDIILVPLLYVILKILDLFQFFLIVHIAISWLENFNIINRYNRFVYLAQNFFFQIYEPILARIRRFMPNLGGIDLAPLALIFTLYFVQGVLARIIQKFPM